MVGSALLSFEVHAQNNRVEIIMCGSFISPNSASEPCTPIRPTQFFSPVANGENVHVVLRFLPFNQDTVLKIIVSRNSPDGEHVDSRQLSVSATDTSAGTEMTVTQSGKYHIKVVNNLNMNDVLGTGIFTVNNETKLPNALIAYITFAVIAALLIVLSFAEVFRLRTPRVIRWFYNKPILLATIITVVVVSLAIYFEGREHNFLQHSNLIGVLGIIGIIGTIIGVILTYGQLKLAEDRIENYEKFYDILDEVLRDNKARSLQFSGSTILPGQVAYGDKALILRYTNALESMANRLSLDNAKVSIIVPSKELYREAYEPYIGKTYRGHKYDEPEIKEMIRRALTVHRLIDDMSDMVEVTRKEEIGIIDAFYFSNGRTVVYAVPLHYNLARAVSMENAGEDTKEEPALIGFKTTDRSIVDAFERNFEKLMSEFGFSLRLSELTDPANLVVKLSDAAPDDLSRHLRDQLSSEMQRQLVEADKSKPPSKPLQAALVDELNRLLKRPDLFNEQLLMQVNLTDEIRSLIERNPQGERLVQLNRLILVAIYPNEIAAKQRA